MKKLLLLLLIPVITLAAPKPIEKEGLVCRTKQQDLELRDWINGIQAQAQLALKSQELVQTQLDSAQQDGIRLASDLANARNKLWWYRLHWWGSWAVFGLGVVVCIAFFVLKAMGKLAFL